MPLLYRRAVSIHGPLAPASTQALPAVPEARTAVSQAVILAAGEGSRLRLEADALPKPLTCVAGVPLLERAIVTCRNAGVAEIVVVVGCERALLLPVLAGLARKHGVRVTPAINPQWNRGNGASALASEPHVRGPFFLMMCDHIVEPSFLSRLIAEDDGERTCAVVVDRGLDGIPDLDEATKTRLEGSRVTAIGKRLGAYDAVDTGVFLCRPMLFDALREAARAGRHGLSDAVQLLAARGEVSSVDSTGLPWIDVDTAEDLRRATWLLTSGRLRSAGAWSSVYGSGNGRERLEEAPVTESTSFAASDETQQSESKGVSGLDGPVSRHLNRPLSRRISARVAASRVTPDQWSWAAFGAVCTGALGFAVGAPRLAGALAHIGSVLDGVDGEVARLQGTASASGALFDLVLDRVSDVAVLAGLAQGAGGRRLDWLLAIAAANGMLTSGLVKERLGAEQRSVSALQRSESQHSPIDRLLPWTGRDGRLLAVTIAGMARAPRLGLAWVAVTSNVRLVRRFAAARTMLRDAEHRPDPRPRVPPARSRRM